MKLELNDDQALVLFEWLSRLDERDGLPADHPSEEKVLWCIHGQLEKTLVEPFREDYAALVDRARKRVEESFEAG